METDFLYYATQLQYIKECQQAYKKMEISENEELKLLEKKTGIPYSRDIEIPALLCLPFPALRLSEKTPGDLYAHVPTIVSIKGPTCYKK